MACCALLLVALRVGGADDHPEDVPVAVIIGQTHIRLSVLSGFSRGALGVPAPGEIPVTDAHDRSHGAHTYCYRYSTKSSYVLLELFDSLTFGMHTARLSRVRGSAQEQCPLLSVEPELLLGTTRYRLSSVTWREPAGFIASKAGDSITMTREWKYSEPSGSGVGAACVWRSISLTIEHPAGAARSLTVQNWEEPGC